MSETAQLIEERYKLTIERIEAILKEDTVPKPFEDYFRKTASFLLLLKETAQELQAQSEIQYTLEQWQGLNQRLYADILPEQYDKSYGNPAYAVAKLGEVHGRILSFLYTELRGIIVYTFENRLEDITILQELFIEIYNCFEAEELPTYHDIQQIIYWFISDYSDVTVTYRVREGIDPSLDFATRIVMEEDLTDLRYLYKYGEYISENEIKMAKHMNALPQETIDLMAATYSEGYRMGFVLGNKDLSKKTTVNIHYIIGFERMIRQAIKNFAKMGLKPVLYRAAAASINKRQQTRNGYYGAIPNKQYDYDHRADKAIYLDKAFVERKLGVLRTAYEEYKELANGHAGPAVVITFGEIPFIPKSEPAAYHLSDKQQELSVAMDNEAGQIVNQYIIGEERSFTIIAFPIPEIGEKFPQIFDEVIKINTLDYKRYQHIQQTMIDALDKGQTVHIQGKGDNRTNLFVQLQELKDPEKQTNFENCVADVNIPVGEVFTSPVLKGTTGILEVSKVYLREFCFENFHMEFEDGMVTKYTCTNFADEEENQKYIKENVLYHHDTLPMGEFAIGTNTTAYQVAKEYQIFDKLPILIAEKTGPHFAIGDTCYSWEEDTATFNPNGKEIIAKENEVSALRKEDVSKAYLSCHTDITIPYEEIAHIEVILADNSRIPIIRDGRFVLAGTEELNKPLESVDKVVYP